jgi:hypothetical protein
MGVTIHYRFAREQEPEELMKKVEQAAKRLGMKIEHRSWNHLTINPHKDSEWIDLHWHKVMTVKARDKDKWDYDLRTIKDLGELEDEMWYCSGFTKTHYAGAEAHVQVAELLRAVAGRCQISKVSDEADYYEAGMSDETMEKLETYWRGYNEQLGLLAAKLKKAFGSENVISGDEL